MKKQNEKALEKLSVPEIEIIKRDESEKLKGGFAIVQTKSAALSAMSNTNCKGTCNSCKGKAFEQG